MEKELHNSKNGRMECIVQLRDINTINSKENAAFVMLPRGGWRIQPHTYMHTLPLDGKSEPNQEKVI